MSEARPGTRRIAIRADSSATLGAGHVRRCLALAEALRDAGCEILFASQGNLDNEIADAGFALVEPDALAAHAPFEALVVDHYGLGAEWERAMRPLTQRIVVIDDLADRAHDCDLIVDVCPPGPGRYDGLVPDHCRRLLGPRYAMLRPEFAALGARLRDGPIRRVLISFGATDNAGRAAAAAAAVRAALGENVAIDMLSGQPPERVAALMAEADLAIGAGGTTSWERACLGLPALVAAIADNQADNVAALEAAGAAIAIPADEGFGAAIEAALASLDLRSMSEAAGALTDGRGALRVAREIAPPILRAAAAGDARDLWTWRNDPRVRAMSKDPAEIPWESHQAWFAARLADPASALLIGEEAGRAVGVLRFDIEGETATVSIYLTPGSHGRGFGPALLRAGEAWLRAKRPAVRRILAEILPGNAASLAAFEAADYVARLSHYERELSDE